VGQTFLASTFLVCGTNMFVQAQGHGLKQGITVTIQFTIPLGMGMNIFSLLLLSY
jgi:hypothetical protein